MANDKELLLVFEQALKQANPSLVQKLNTGLTVDEINKIASSCQLTFTGEIYDLFSWKNGIQHQSIGSVAQLLLFPNGIPFNLIEAVHDYDLLSVTKHFFEPNYFPLFYNENEDLLLIDLDEDSETYSMISLYSPTLLGNSEPMTIYDSLSDLLKTAISCYEQKVFWITQDGLQMDADAYYQTASTLNPNSQYWQFM